MPWSNWIELPFRNDGTLDKSSLSRVPDVSGVYAIAGKKQNGLYVTHYVGRSSRSMRERLERHLSGRGNHVIGDQLVLKKSVPSAPASICVAYLATNEHKIIEALYLDTDDRPVCNIIRACLPAGLLESSIRNAKLE